MNKIVFVEDDPEVGTLIAAYLGKHDMDVVVEPRGDRAEEVIAREKPDLVLLDIMLPEEDGLQVLKKLRADPATRRTPVLMLTAKSTEYDKVLGLDQGADDYIAKPFGMMELMARIRTALRHAGGREEPETVYRLGQLYADPGRHIVRDGERDVALTLKEFQLLCLLLEHRGTVFTRDQLLNTIWGYEFDGASRTVDVHIRSLRQKLGAAGGQIETVRGVGYRLRETAV